MADLKNILLTGEPGIGKTTIIQAVLAELPTRAAGFFTHEIKAGKKRVGFELVTLDGQKATLAHQNSKSSYKVANYGVDVSVMDKIAAAVLEDALKAPAPLIVIDEIGKMESFSKKFRDLTIACLDSKIPVLGTIQNFAHPIIETVMNRPDVVIITVTRENREMLVPKLVELLKLQVPDETEV